MFFFLGLTFSCNSVSGREVSQSEETDLKKTEVRAGKIFLAGHTGDHRTDTAEILLLIKNLVEDTVRKDFSKLPDRVSPKDGLLLDLKGIWTREEIKKELSKKEIISRFIFRAGTAEKAEELRKRKNGSGFVFTFGGNRGRVLL